MRILHPTACDIGPVLLWGIKTLKEKRVGIIHIKIVVWKQFSEG